jgi:hypothetical protein
VFSEKELADLTIAIGLMNAFNRLAIQRPDHYELGAEAGRSSNAIGLRCRVLDGPNGSSHDVSNT